MSVNSKRQRVAILSQKWSASWSTVIGNRGIHASYAARSTPWTKDGLLDHSRGIYELAHHVYYLLLENRARSLRRTNFIPRFRQSHARIILSATTTYLPKELFTRPYFLHYRGRHGKGTSQQPPRRSSRSRSANGRRRRTRKQKVHLSYDESSARIKACEEELESRREAIVMLRDVVMKQRATIHSLKAEQNGTGQISPSPRRHVPEQLVSENSAISGSNSTGGSVSFEEDNPITSPAILFEQIRQSQEESEDEMSEITCDDESSIDSSNFLKMEYEMQAMIESLKEQALSPIVASPSDAVVSFETPFTPDINGAIESIQEQASHVDAAIALDKLQTTKNELLVVTNELQNRTNEVGELGNQIKVLQCQIATLELERDLHVSISCS